MRSQSFQHCAQLTNLIGAVGRAARIITMVVVLMAGLAAGVLLMIGPCIGPFGFPNADPSVDTVIVMFSTLTQAVQSLAEVGLPSARQNNVVKSVNNITPIDFA